MMSSMIRRLALLALCLVPVTLPGPRLVNAVSADQGTADQSRDSTRPLNQLTDDETKAGWKLLFDGKSFAGWHTFKRDDVRPGWQIKDGAVVCADPRNAGDLVTADKFDWFELSIEYTISEAGNSGILFHVTDEGRTTWNTGPEIQLLDNKMGRDPQRSGWLYQLYRPENDSKTNQPVDATKPVGEWNRIQIIISAAPAKSEIAMNGVKYYDFVYGGDDFKARVAKSKFNTMPGFAKSNTGFIALQGDHGTVSFRNIKLRPLTNSGTQTQSDK
jgi:hypothetical protein